MQDGLIEIMIDLIFTLIPATAPLDALAVALTPAYQMGTVQAVPSSLMLAAVHVFFKVSSIICSIICVYSF